MAVTPWTRPQAHARGYDSITPNPESQIPIPPVAMAVTPWTRPQAYARGYDSITPNPESRIPTLYGLVLILQRLLAGRDGVVEGVENLPDEIDRTGGNEGFARLAGRADTGSGK